MRTSSTLFLLLIALSPAVAKPKVAVINVQRAMVSTQDGKDAAATLTSKYAPDQVRMAKEQQEIDDLNKVLGDGAPRTEQETAQLRTRIDAVIRNHRRHQEDLQAKVEQDRNQVLADLYAKLRPVIETIAKQRRFEVVLRDDDSNSAVLWRADKTDITDEVIKRYELAHPKR